VRIQRRLGEMLAEVVRAGKPELSRETTIPKGITRDQSSKWQRLAAMEAEAWFRAARRAFDREQAQEVQSWTSWSALLGRTSRASRGHPAGAAEGPGFA
jgi:hypothetical protein